MDDIQKLENTKWILEKQLNWISAGDTKIGAIVSLNLAMMGALFGFYDSNQTDLIINIMFMVTFCTILLGLAFCKYGFKPRFSPPNDSVIFFGTIVNHKIDEYIDKFNHIENGSFLEDIVQQIHRNAEIANAKYMFLAKGVTWLIVTAFLWSLTIALSLFGDVSKNASNQNATLVCIFVLLFLLGAIYFIVEKNKIYNKIKN